MKKIAKRIDNLDYGKIEKNLKSYYFATDKQDTFFNKLKDKIKYNTKLLKEN